MIILISEGKTAFFQKIRSYTMGRDSEVVQA